MAKIEEVEKLGLAEMAERVSMVSVFMVDSTYEEMVEMLHGKKYELNSYYMGSGGTLAVSYDIEGIDFTFFCTDAEHALEKISGGKCKIETKETINKEKAVVCSMEV